MDDLERVKQLTEGLLDGKVSRLEHAKRIGRMGMTDTLRLTEALIDSGVFQDAQAVGEIRQLHNSLREYLKILRNI